MPKKSKSAPSSEARPAKRAKTTAPSSPAPAPAPSTKGKGKGSSSSSSDSPSSVPPPLPPPPADFAPACPSPPYQVVLATRCPAPKRDAATGSFHFADAPTFRPNLSPAEVLQMGSFGGTYFRPIRSKVVCQQLADQHLELPKEWLEGLKHTRMVTSSVYRPEVNKYGVKCGASLDEWEGSGWISNIDPYGWFQWYCRFFQGRRSSDDARQIARGLACTPHPF